MYKIILLHLFEPLKRPLASRLIKGTVSEVFPNVMIQEVLECHWEDRVQPARRLSRTSAFVPHHLHQKSPTIYSKTVAAVLPPKLCLFQGGSRWLFLTSAFLEMCRHLFAAVKPAMDLCCAVFTAAVNLLILFLNPRRSKQT